MCFGLSSSIVGTLTLLCISKEGKQDFAMQQGKQGVVMHWPKSASADAEEERVGWEWWGGGRVEKEGV